MLDANVGLSTAIDSKEAGKEAAKEALGGLKTKPKLAILAVDELTKKKYNYKEVLEGVQSIIGPEPVLIGSTVNGMMVNDRFTLKSVGLMLIGGDFDIDYAFQYEKSRLEYKKIADDILQKKNQLNPKDNRIMLMFQDGMKFPPIIMEQQSMLNTKLAAAMSGLFTKVFKFLFKRYKKQGIGMPTVQELISELYEQDWNIPVIGNIATDPNLSPLAYEFYNNKVLEDAVTGVILSEADGTKFGHGFAAGAEPTGVTCHATKNIGNFLLRIDKKKAIEGFCDAININVGSLEELENQGYVNYYHILGTREKVKDKELFHLTGTMTNPHLRGLVTTSFPFDKVPDEMEIFRSNINVLLKTTESAILDAKQNIQDPKFLLGIDCIFRLSSYGDNLPRYIKTVREAIGEDVPRLILGSGGEIYGTKRDDYYFNSVTLITLVGGN
ncbi:MAG: hypothetical protein GF364_01895 [Candidatus Lokiarchaeota archaeon]|nr:hypothetical protein [Candidatus Lokiarchaeota archaeon]